jgi:hypothetical protein
MKKFLSTDYTTMETVIVCYNTVATENGELVIGETSLSVDMLSASAERLIEGDNILRSEVENLIMSAERLKGRSYIDNSIKSVKVVDC